MNTTVNSAIRKTFRGTERDLEDGRVERREFKFESSDLGKYIVVKMRYEQHADWSAGLFFGTQLSINSNKLNTHDDQIYGVYRIDLYPGYHDGKDIFSYKVKLTPMGKFNAWCPDRSWYTSDMESIINKEYDLFTENPIFDTEAKAIAFALKKNFELYPDKRSAIKKLFDYIKSKF